MRQDIQFTDKEQVFYNKYIGDFATPKKLNRSSKNVPSEIIEAIESGQVTSEMIKKTAEIVPIFTYKTCLTIHGNLPPILINRIGGYKNIIQNKNGSLEIRYSAIDYLQKKEIRRMLYNSQWQGQENSSTGIYFQKTKVSNEKGEALAIYEALKTEAEKFNIEGMKAKVFVSGYNYFGRYYLILSVYPLIIEGKPIEIAAKMANVKVEDIQEKIEEEQRKEQQRHEAAQAAQAQREAAKSEAETKLRQYPQQPVKPIIGAIYAYPLSVNNGNAGYRFLKVDSAGNFGRVILSTYISTSLNIEADKFIPYMKGKQVKPTEINFTTYKIN